MVLLLNIVVVIFVKLFLCLLLLILFCFYGIINPKKLKVMSLCMKAKEVNVR